MFCFSCEWTQREAEWKHFDEIQYTYKNIPMWIKSDLYLCYRTEDLITPQYWSCSVLFILTNQSLLLCDWKLVKWLSYCTAFQIHYLIGRNHDAICKYKVHLSTINNGELSDRLWENLNNRGLELLRRHTKLSN